MLAKVSGTFTGKVMEKVDSCTYSMYQAVSPLLKAPGDEAKLGIISIEPNECIQCLSQRGIWGEVEIG